MYPQLPTGNPTLISDAELDAFLVFAHALADTSGPLIRQHFRTHLEADDKPQRARFDPVTVADRAAETALRKLIRERCPEHGIFGEEHGYEEGNDPLTWVLDPIDGTKAFLTGLPIWGTLIALYDGEKPVLGIMDQPYTRERFVGSRFGTELHKADSVKRLRTRCCETLASAIMQTTHPAMFTRQTELDAYRSLSDQVLLTRFSGDCYGYCMLAHGLIDLVVEADLQPYDILALIPIIEAAGGVVSDWSGGAATAGGQVIAAGDPTVHEQALALLGPASI